MEMITVHGWCAGGMGGVWEDKFSGNGGDGKRLLPKLSATFS